MSLLLDALKKAALEKQRRDQNAGDEMPPNGMPPNGMPPTPDDELPAIDRPSEPPEPPELTDALTLDASPEPPLDLLDLDALDDAPPTLEFAAPASLPAANPAMPPRDDDLGDVLAFDDEPTLTAAPRTSDDLSLALQDNEPTPVRKPALSLHDVDSHPPAAEPLKPEPLKPAPSPVAASTTAPSAAAPPAPEPPPPTKPGGFDPASGKAAMAQLMATSEKAAQRERRKRAAWVGLLVIVAGALIGTYYYYLESADSQLITALPSRPQPVDDGLYAPDPDAAPPDAELAVADGLESEAPGTEAPEAGELGTEAPTSDAVRNQNTAPADSAPTEPAPTEPTPTEPTLADAAASHSATTAQALAPTASSNAPAPAQAAATTPAAALTTATTTATSEPTTPAPAAPNRDAGTLTRQRSEPGTDASTARAPSVAQATPPANRLTRVDVTPRIERRIPERSPLNTALQAAYSAYHQGDLNNAETAYQQALQFDPQQRDALLGLAAVQARQGRYDLALRTYQQRLHAAPLDPDARAGLLGLLAADNPGPALETELHTLLREQPDAAYLHFLKGSLAVARQQWPVAQRAFFDALQRDPRNPDYAFNLAVALDHLAQPREALRHYRLAMSYADQRQPAFDVSAAQRRIATLEARVP